MVLLAAVIHASWNRVLHAEDDRVAAMAVAGVLAGVVLLPAVVLGEVWSAWPLILASATAHTFYAACLSAAYRRGALSVAYPLGRGVAPLLVTIGGWLLLAQRPDTGAILGAGLLAAGLALIAVTGGRAGQSSSVVFALLTGLTIAGYSVVDAGAVQQVDPVGYLGAVLGLQGLALTIVLLFRGKGASILGSVRSGALIAIGSVVAYVLVLYAFQMAPAGRVSTLRESSVLVGILISGDRPPKSIWAGAGLVLAGALLAAG